MTQPALHPTQVSRDELLSLRPLAQQLKANPAQRSRAQAPGQHPAVFRARGMEFEEHRVYAPGDDVRMIDWRVTARTGTAHCKLFREERERPVLIVIDLSASMRFATRGRFKSVRAAQAGIFSAWIAAQRGDRVGGLITTGERHMEVRPASGNRGVLRLIHALLELQQDAGNGLQLVPGHLQQLLSRLQHVAHPGSQAFIYSDLSDWNTAAEQQFKRLARHVPSTVGCISDPIEIELPPVGGELAFVQNDRRGHIDSASIKQRDAWQAQFAELQSQRRRAVVQSGAHWIDLSTADDPSERLRERFSLLSTARQAA